MKQKMRVAQSAGEWSWKRCALLVVLVVSILVMGCEDNAVVPKKRAASAAPQRSRPFVAPRRAVPSKQHLALIKLRKQIDAITARMTEVHRRGVRWFTPQVERACRAKKGGHGVVLFPMVGRRKDAEPIWGVRLLICGKEWLRPTRWLLQSGKMQFSRDVAADQVWYERRGEKSQAHLGLMAGLEHPYAQSFLRQVVLQLALARYSVLVLTHNDGTSQFPLKVRGLTQRASGLFRLLHKEHRLRNP